MTASGPLCIANLRDGSRCRSVAAHGDLCAHHAELAAKHGRGRALNGDHVKRRNARERIPVVAESAPFEAVTRSSNTPAAVRPALALTAAEEVETIRRVLLEAATSTTRETWVSCTCPECGKGFRQEISVPDHGARIKAIETLLREGLGRVGETNAVQPKTPTTVDEVKALSRDELNLVFAITYAEEIAPSSTRATTLSARRSRSGSRTHAQPSLALWQRSAEPRLGSDTDLHAVMVRLSMGDF
jgi:hypothetical protein